MNRPTLALVTTALLAVSACQGVPSLSSGLGQPVAVVAVPASTAACRVVDGRADARCTPGVINPQVTQADIASTVCRSGWTATVRPSTSYTGPLKLRQMAMYGEPGPASLYEEDHLVPLSAGGSPTDPRNLFPEPYAGRGAHTKDTEESSLRRAVCGGRLTLAEARAQIVRDWVRP
ncbi:MAG: hypothetical protein ACRDXE_01475 [Acidimicrobiales bacterium]